MLNDRMSIIDFLDRHGRCSWWRPKLRAINYGCISICRSVKPRRNSSWLGRNVANSGAMEFSMRGRSNPVYGNAMINHSIVHDGDVVHDSGLFENSPNLVAT